MAIKKFPSLHAALAAGFTIDLGNGKYAQGGETISRDRYQHLLDPIKQYENTQAPFSLPDARDKPLT